MPTKIDKLQGVHPRLIEAAKKIIFAGHELGYDLIVTDGLRTTEQQVRLYAQGRTSPGKIVTFCDGVRKKSNHQAKPDGFGHAVDMCFRINGQPSWDDSLPWRLLGEMAKATGCKWGGDWETPDRPHIELPQEFIH
jgi:peptidoglycan L-alanyl-D-glutamate endopeptidase CwlK